MSYIARFISPMALAIGAFAISFSAMASEKQINSQVQLQELQQQIEIIKNNHQLEIEALNKSINDLALQPKDDQAKLNSGPSSLLGDTFKIGLSGLFAAAGSNANNGELSGLQAGGHDPNRNGFSVQNVELSIGATVDNYLDAQANIIFLIDSEGETAVELEEAFFTTRHLPFGFQIKAGQYFTEFGRHNPQHPHTWAFVDQPIVLSRFFGGDGLRSQGVRASWLAPTPWYSELYIGAQNANGETVTSFLAEGEGEDPSEPETIGGYSLTSRDARDQSDLLYSARWLNGFDVSNNLSMNIGLSGLLGPNASAKSTDTTIVGADVYLKWQPNQTQRGFPFVSWHTEILQRRYEAIDGTTLAEETLKDWGIFSQVLWGFKPKWAAGFRVEYAEASGGYNKKDDPLRDQRKRVSPNITWFSSEYSKVRLQYNKDWADHLVDHTSDSIFLQVEFTIGSHAAHNF